MRKEEEEQQFRAELQQLEFVKKIEIFPYKTNPVRMMLINLIIKIKGIIFDNSLTDPDSEDDLFDGAKILCSQEKVKEGGAKVMVNIVKINENNKEALEKYNMKVVFELFSKIGSFIFDSGTADSEYWSM